MRSINDFYYHQAPRVLFHYTGVGSLLGMARTKCVWASNVYYLNDSREVLHACEVLRGRICLLIDQSSDVIEVEFLRQLRLWIESFKQNHYNIFVFSLSEQESLLSQWRSYTPHGKGVSLGFSPEIIKLLADGSSCVLAKCIYQAHEHEELAQSLIEKIIETFRKNLTTWEVDVSCDHSSQKYFHFLEKYRRDFLRALCIIKNPAFSEEQEWRLISDYFCRHTDSAIFYREGASMLVPSIELAFPEVNPIFERVCLGPSEHQNLSMSVLAQFLSSKRLANHVINTGVPYREWR